MAPIPKNIRVVDENGNQYEATYPKRAAGLVKHGRARFTAPDTICLVCPPNTDLNEDLEDSEMSENTAIETVAEEIAAAPAADSTLSMAYILGKIDQIARQTDYLMSALEKLNAMPPSDGPGDIAGQARAQAVGDIVRCRETTNQRLLELYEKMYDDLKPKAPVNSRLAALERMKEMLVHTNGDPDLWDSVRQTLSLFEP